MTSLNSLGWEIQSYNRDRGWKPLNAAAVPHPTEEAARAEMRERGLEGNSYFRVYEAPRNQP